MQAITVGLPANADCLEAYAKAQANDKICSQLIEFCTTEWPKNQLSRKLKMYWKFQASVMLTNSYFVVVPRLHCCIMKYVALAKIQHGHQGIQRCS